MGDFWGIPARGLHSVVRGDIVDIHDRSALQMVLNGRAQTDLTGELLRDGQAPPPRELAELRKKIAELQPPDPIDQLRDRSKLDPTERAELTRRALNM